MAQAAATGQHDQSLLDDDDRVAEELNCSEIHEQRARSTSWQGRVSTDEGGPGFWGATSQTVKIIVGTGVIALPSAVKSAGWLVATLGLPVIGWLSAYSMKTLIEASQAVREMKATRLRTRSDASGGQAGQERPGGEDVCFDEGEVTVREIAFVTFGNKGMLFSDCVVISAQLFSVVAFVAFIAEALASVINTIDANMSNVVESSTATRDCVLLVLLPVLGFLCTLRSTASLESLATCGNIIFLCSFTTVLMFGFGTADVSLEGTSAAQGLSGLSTFFGSVLFAFAAQSECMSVEQFLPKSTQKRYGRVLDVSILIAAVIYVLWGVLCYVFFKGNTKDVIFDNIVSSETSQLTCNAFGHKSSVWMNLIVKTGMALMIVVNIPFSMYGAAQNIEVIVWGPATPRKWLNILVEPKMAFERVVLVVFCLGFAALVPDFGFLVSFVGCFSQTIFAFVLPPAFYLQLHWSKLREEKLYGVISLHFSILVFGIVVTIITTTQLLVDKFT